MDRIRKYIKMLRKALDTDLAAYKENRGTGKMELYVTVVNQHLLFAIHAEISELSLQGTT